ncbi:hypothetical protein OKW50_000096 [Paraburkholderia youngii]|uniref:hypothetical protein n=1 Tax=Paraburkholderia youngii TaxID=2782701 RepID=UPI003D1D1424
MSDERTTIEAAIERMAESNARAIVGGMRELADVLNIMRLKAGCAAMTNGELFTLVRGALQVELAHLYGSNVRTVIDLIERIETLEANGGGHAR